MNIGGLDLGVGGGVRLGGGSSPMVAGASTPGVSVAQAAYGAGATTASSGSSSIFGLTPGHLTIHIGGLALIVLVLIRHSLPKQGVNMRSPFVKGMLVGILGVYVYHRFIGVPTGVKGSVPGGSIGQVAGLVPLLSFGIAWMGYALLTWGVATIRGCNVTFGQVAFPGKFTGCNPDQGAATGLSVTPPPSGASGPPNDLAPIPKPTVGSQTPTLHNGNLGMVA